MPKGQRAKNQTQISISLSREMLAEIEMLKAQNAKLRALQAGAAWCAAVVVVVAGLVVTFVADHFVRPALIGGATRLPFLWVLLGILGGVESFGLLGLFLGPAVMAALVLLWREYTAGDDRPVS